MIVLDRYSISPIFVYLLYCLEEFHRCYEGPQPSSLDITVGDLKYFKFDLDIINISTSLFANINDIRIFRRDLERFINNHPLAKSYDPLRSNKFRVMLADQGSNKEHLRIQLQKGKKFIED